jgi:hypothetical protein
MTYVIGVQQCGLVSFVADSVTTNHVSGDPHFQNMKTGILFPGCLYGFCGNAERAWRCIATLRAVGQSREDPGTNWDRLVQAAERYRFVINDDSQHFTILLSSRHDGSPKMYELSSETEQLRPIEETVYTMGSGSTVPELERHVRKYIQQRLSPNRIRGAVEAGERMGRPLPADHWAYEIPFRLMQIQFGNQTAFRLARVGGFFHLLLQSSEAEWRQEPTFYVLATLNPVNRIPIYRTRRIAFDSKRLPHELLYLYERVAPDKDRAEILTLQMLKQSQVEELWKEQFRGPPYKYMIAGIIDSKLYGQRHMPLIDIYDGRFRAVGFGNELDDGVAEYLEGHLYGRVKEYCRQHKIDTDRPISVDPTVRMNKRYKRRLY